MENNSASALINGILELGLTPDKDKINQLNQYAGLLLKWNKAYSLTTITELQKITIYHLLDGLTVVNYLQQADNILDVGSGMGVPGVIIAIWYPDKKISVIDCNHKKCAFLRQVAIELKLKNLSVICKKIEDHTPGSCYDLVISRAFSSGVIFIDKVKTLVNGSVLMMKSHKLKDEIGEIIDYKHEIFELKLPFSTDKRYLLKIEL